VNADVTLSVDLRNVEAPFGLMDPVCDVLLELETRFLRQLVTLAKSKPNIGDRWVVGREELLLAAQTVLSDAAEEIATGLANNETSAIRLHAA
jgi:hypothetical protein